MHSILLNQFKARPRSGHAIFTPKPIIELVNLYTKVHLELSQALVQALIQRQLGSLDLEFRVLRFSLGRLQGGQFPQFQLGPNHLQLALKFATGPALQLQVQIQGFDPEHQTLRLKVERLQLSGFAGSPVLNLLPAKVLETAVTQANRRVPGLITLHKNMELRLHLEPLLQKALQEAPLGAIFAQQLGLELNPQTQVHKLELLEGKLRLELEGQA